MSTHHEDLLVQDAQADRTTSSMPEDKATPPQPKSKQERIRDNQRRSRARRQEYLADLERRLSDCQLTCREANIQRAAFLELQIENTRLRELLSLAGVNDDFVEHYVSEAVAQSGQFPRETNPSLRQIKPKIATMEPARILTNNVQEVPSSRALTRGAVPINTNTADTRLPDTNVPSTPTSTYISSTPFPLPTMSEMTTPTTAPDWLYQQASSLSTQQSCDFYCDTFQVAAKGSTKIADESSVLCSVAQHMIDQFELSPQEMEQVKAKLATGFCRPSYPGAGCAVNNQTLFQILNELSARYS
ncbi:hypothetical protein H2198_007825 [Neophaeococcomyces mojaviensis]|uniref:Uncharacterized protein n=1 Tax=Neophaeococcomyces mojaviensis TaxID=3383035 RepID=A0ACC2ZZ28_9EURO|nr:hypothetical protein H2198_007825 [Knufia sp. JES_112]